jgi:hypothetical protein
MERKLIDVAVTNKNHDSEALEFHVTQAYEVGYGCILVHHPLEAWYAISTRAREQVRARKFHLDYLLR